MDRLGNLFSLNAFNLFHLNRRAPGNYNIIFQQLFNAGAANILYFFIFFFFVWVLYLFLVSHPLVSAVPWVFSILFGLYTLPAAAPWVFLALSGFSYPRNTEILCMSFSYNTQDSIGKRFPQPFL